MIRPLCNLVLRLHRKILSNRLSEPLTLSLAMRRQKRVFFGLFLRVVVAAHLVWIQLLERIPQVSVLTVKLVHVERLLLRAVDRELLDVADFFVVAKALFQFLLPWFRVYMLPHVLYLRHHAFLVFSVVFLTDHLNYLFDVFFVHLKLVLVAQMNKSRNANVILLKLTVAVYDISQVLCELQESQVAHCQRCYVAHWHDRVVEQLVDIINVA